MVRWETTMEEKIDHSFDRNLGEYVNFIKNYKEEKIDQSFDRNIFRRMLIS